MGSPASRPARSPRPFAAEWGALALLVSLGFGATRAAAAPADSLGAAAVAADSVAGAAPDSVPAAAPDTARAAPSPPPPASFHAAEWETLYGGLPEEARLGPVFNFRYNRVDGPAVTLGAAVSREDAPAPLLYAKLGYAFSRERGLYDAGFEIPFGNDAIFRVGGAAYRRTATQDGWIVGETENTFFALFARTDYRDHYESKGFEGRVIWDPGRDFALGVEGRFESERSLETSTKFSLFGDEDEFRENPPVEEGDLGLLTATARVGPSTLPREGGTSADLTYERAGDPMGGDFEYGRLRGALRGRTRFARSQEARARIIGGSTVDGTLPSQMNWHVGGIGTLRGHEYKKHDGDQFLLANAEYYYMFRKNMWGLAFLDWGSAWFGRDNIDRQQFALDGGLGIRLGDGPTMVTVARNLQRSDAPYLVGVRLGGTF
jgi:hypothetical protein